MFYPYNNGHFSEGRGDGAWSLSQGTLTDIKSVTRGKSISGQPVLADLTLEQMVRSEGVI